MGLPVPTLLRVFNALELGLVSVAGVPDVADPQIDQALLAGLQAESSLHGPAAVVPAYYYVLHLPTQRPSPFALSSRTKGRVQVTIADTYLPTYPLHSIILFALSFLLQAMTTRGDLGYKGSEIIGLSRGYASTRHTFKCTSRTGGVMRG